MKKQAIQWAVNLGQKIQHLFVATSDNRGLPHVAAASKMYERFAGKSSLKGLNTFTEDDLDVVVGAIARRV